ncbi:hypothetical protein M422DRAFT_45920 [Sphaerobolus stellatus SS14]|uniref:Uncharacterized protein n=1 Tax=Sphaerobolus stellatus (strain SS14) TaxID=990650 RepID=A0A0C9VVF7_SPHS4|nr:hypothetical protein M422DRAFT_45920 [Sphaerobolus stellatus SS14]
MPESRLGQLNITLQRLDSAESLKSVKRFIFSYEGMPSLNQLQALNKLPNMEQMQLSLKISEIASEALHPRPSACLKSLCLKMTDSAITAQCLLKLSLPSLHGFILQHDSDIESQYQQPNFSLNEIFDAVEKIRAGRINCIALHRFQINADFVAGPFKKLNTLFEPKFINCRITESVLDAFAFTEEQRFSNFPWGDLCQLLNERAKGDSEEEA